jgi:putative transposase
VPRKPRISPIGIPQHIITRGNNRQVCFTSEDDMAFYISCLKDYSKKYKLQVHAWVLMTNHIHLLCTPFSENSVSKTMQDVGRLYVVYFNKTYKRTGTLWEGRYKSSLVQSESYLLSVYRYIELNPVRAGMVEDPADYSFSSYQINALGKASSLCTPHDEYLALGNTQKDRRDSYRTLFEYELDGGLIDNIRKTTNQGMAIGNEDFITQIKILTGYDMMSKNRGRPKGWRKEG